jgi:hypothetical protein
MVEEGRAGRAASWDDKGGDGRRTGEEKREDDGGAWCGEVGSGGDEQLACLVSHAAISRFVERGAGRVKLFPATRRHQQATVPGGIWRCGGGSSRCLATAAPNAADTIKYKAVRLSPLPSACAASPASLLNAVSHPLAALSHPCQQTQPLMKLAAAWTCMRPRPKTLAANAQRCHNSAAIIPLCCCCCCCCRRTLSPTPSVMEHAAGKYVPPPPTTRGSTD